MKQEHKKLFLFAGIAFVLVLLLRLPFYNPMFYEGDDAAIAAGIQCWVKNGNFQNAPLYRNHFQYGTYFLVYFLCKLSGANALGCFYFLVFTCGTLFTVAISTWFVSITKLPPPWIIVTSICVILLPELFFTSTVYPNTSILSASCVATGFIALQLLKSKPFLYRSTVPGLLFSFAMALRMDAPLMFLPAVLMISYRDSSESTLLKIKEIFVTFSLTLFFWLTGAFAASVDFHELYLSFYSHTQDHHTGFNDTLGVLYSGLSINILMAFFIALEVILRKKLIHHKIWTLLIALALPCCINFYHLTTPKYILPLYTAIALFISLAIHHLITGTQKRTVFWGYLLVTIFTLHLWVGRSYNPETMQEEWIVLKPASPLKIMNHDGPRPNGSMFLSVLALDQGPLRFYNEFYNQFFNDISKSGHNIGMICQDWADWGLFRYFMALHADNYARHGSWTEWEWFPEYEVFTIGNSNIFFYYNQQTQTFDYYLRDLSRFNRLIVPESLAHGHNWDTITKNWSISETVQGRLLLVPNSKK